MSTFDKGTRVSVHTGTSKYEGRIVSGPLKSCGLICYLVESEHFREPIRVPAHMLAPRSAEVVPMPVLINSAILASL